MKLENLLNKLLFENNWEMDAVPVEKTDGNISFNIAEINPNVWSISLIKNGKVVESTKGTYEQIIKKATEYRNKEEYKNLSFKTKHAY